LPQTYGPLLTPASYIHRGVAGLERAAKEAITELLAHRDREEGLYGLAFHAYMRAALMDTLSGVCHQIEEAGDFPDLQVSLGSVIEAELERIYGDYMTFADSLGNKCRAIGMSVSEAEHRLCKVFMLQTKQEKQVLSNVLTAAGPADSREAVGSEEHFLTQRGSIKRRPEPSDIHGGHQAKLPRPTQT